MSQNERSLAHDVLWGAEAIANHLQQDVRKIYYLLERRHLRAKKIGKIWVGSKSGLAAQLTGAEPEPNGNTSAPEATAVAAPETAKRTKRVAKANG